MKKILEQFSLERIIHIGGTVLVIFAMLSSILRPQVVSTKTQDVLAVLTGNSFEKNEFPEIGPREPIKKIWVRTTAYSSTADQTDSTPCVTANGFDLCEYYDQHGVETTLAANFLPLGARVRIPELYGDRIFVVRDRMNRRYGWGRGDLWLSERGQAKLFGVKRVEWEIL